MLMHCDHQFTIYITKNPIFHDCTGISSWLTSCSRLFVKKVICTMFTHLQSDGPISWLITISPKIFSTLCDKLGMIKIDIYDLVWGGVLDYGCSLLYLLSRPSLVILYICSCCLLIRLYYYSYRAHYHLLESFYFF